MLNALLNPIYQLIITGSITILIYLPTLTKLVAQWQEDENYSHGFIIPFISAFLIYEKRHKLKQIEIKPAFTGIIVVVLGLIVYALGAIGADLFIQRCSFLIIIPGLVIALLGNQICQEISFPLVYLLFMIPLPYVIFYAIASPLKLFVGKVAVWILKEAGLPIEAVGSDIFMPNARLTVAYACSGLRSLLSLTALGAVFGYYTQNKLWKRSVIFAATVPIAIISNIIRIMSACLVAFVYGEKVATGFLHDFSGFIVFVVAVMLLILVGGILWEKPAKTTSSS